jgi:hypothetical protein
MELAKECQVYMTMRRRGLYLFCESSYSAVWDHCQKHHGPAAQSPVNILTLSVLKEEDGWKFVSKYLAKADAEAPQIVESDVQEYMRTRIQNQGRTRST